MARKAQTLEERFWTKVDKTPGHGPNGDCWLWTGAVDTPGYGAIKVNGKKRNAHRVAYELVNGKITGIFDVMHSCDVRLCCNTAHLKLGSRTENVLDALDKQRLAMGERNPNGILSERLVRAIRLLNSAARMSYYAIARALRLPPRTVEMVVKRETWKHLQ